MKLNYIQEDNNKKTIYTDNKLFRVDKKFVTTQLECILSHTGMVESSLSKIYQHSGNGFGMVSAFRDTYTHEENLERTKQLERDIRSKDLGYIETVGRYVYENGTISDEYSFFIPYYDKYTDDEFKKIIHDLAAKYEQESYIAKTPEMDSIELITTDTGVVDKMLPMDVNNIEQCSSFLIKGNHAGRKWKYDMKPVEESFGIRVAENIAQRRLMDKYKIF